MTFSVLTAVVFLPLLGALCLAFLPREEHGQQRVVALTFMLLTLAAAILAVVAFDAGPDAPEFQLQAQAAWIPALGISFHIGVDGIGLVLVLLTAFLGPLVVLSTFASIKERVKEFLISLLILQTAMLGAFAALDLFLFYLFWEAMLVPMALLIGIWGHERRVYAAVKFFLFTFTGSLLMLVAILYLYFAGAKGGTPSFDYLDILKTAPALPATTQHWLFLAFALSFAVKLPMVPLHTWLPDAHVEAPAAGSVVLAGVLLKLGGFGFLRYAVPLFPDAARALQPLLATLSVAAILYGALMCLAQQDLKKLVAYSSVSHMGFVTLGVAALSVEGITGSVTQMINHGISTSAIFLMVGMLYDRRHTRAMSEFGGLARSTPVLAVFFFLAVLSSIGLPGTNGFIGEFLVLAGTWNSPLPNGPWFAAAGALGVILGAVYMLWMYQRVFLGPLRRAENRTLSDLSAREWVVLLPLAALIPLVGIVPQPLLDRIEPAAHRLVERLERPHAEQEAPPAAGKQGGPVITPLREHLGQPKSPFQPSPPQRTFPPQLVPALRPHAPPPRAP